MSRVPTTCDRGFIARGTRYVQAGTIVFCNRKKGHDGPCGFDPTKTVYTGAAAVTEEQTSSPS